MGSDFYIPRTCQRRPPSGQTDEGDSPHDFIVSENGRDSIPWGQQCLVLLGEPGIGKTREFENAAAIAKLAGEKVLYLSLGSFSSVEELKQAITGSETWKAWLNGKHCLHLFLDSLDEGRLCIPTIGCSVTRLLESVKIHLPRLNLRISSRVPDWPQDTERKFQSLFEAHGGCAVYQLLPLNESQRDQWITACGLDQKNFVAALTQSEVVALAEIPFTLVMLVNIFKRDKCLPPSKKEIYQQACRLLCEEQNNSRRERLIPNPADPDHRLAIATRIAGCVVFGNKGLISIASGLEPTANGAIAISELAGETKPRNGNGTSINESHIRDVLGTGLFLSTDRGCYQFVHRSIAEYLAAQYARRLINRPGRLQGLFFRIFPGDPRLYPQLATTAAWLASIESSFFDQVVKSDPLVLLQADIGALSDSQKSKIVESILNAFASDRANDFNISAREHYRKLAHPKLADQLRPVITDKAMGLIRRRFAIDLAGACGATPLLDTLAALALDTADDHHLRERAAWAIHQIDDVGTVQRVRRLVCSDAQSDPDDEIRGIVMIALWPRGLITIRRLAKTIQPPRQPNLYGAFRMFLDFHLLQHVRDPAAELPIILNCLSQYVNRGEFDRLSDSLIRQSAGLASGNPAVLRALANYLWARSSIKGRPFSHMADAEDGKNIFSDAPLRREILVAIAELAGPESFHLADSQNLFSAGLLVAEDYNWLINKVTTELDAVVARRLSVLINQVYGHVQSDDKLQTLLVAANSCEALRLEFQDIIAPVALNSTQADSQRANWQTFLQRGSAVNQPASASPASPIALSEGQFRDRVVEFLLACEKGRPDAWWRLDLLLQSGLTGATHYAFHPNIRDLPGWKLLPDELYPRLRAAALAYLQNGDPRDAEWIGSGTFRQCSLAGFRALVLLHELPSAESNAIGTHCWNKWIPTILHFPRISGIGGESDIPCKITAAAYHADPDQFIEALRNKIDLENRKPKVGTMEVLGLLRQCWDERLSRAVLDTIDSQSLKPWAAADIIGRLFIVDRTSTASVATRILDTIDLSQGCTEYAGLITAELLFNAPELGWEVVWKVMQSHPEVGKLAVERVAFLRPYSPEFLAPLPEGHVAELFAWLENNYPGAMDLGPNSSEGHVVGCQKSVGWLMRGILDNLRDRGTAEAVGSLKLILRRSSKLSWLQHTIVIAEENLRRKDWTPIQPQDLIQLAAHSDSRTVRNAAELQLLLVEILSEINADLQGENPMAPQLWSSQDSQWNPKDENDLSDWLLWQIKLRLRGYAILPLREVEIRRRSGSVGAPGQRADIYVAVFGAEASGQKLELFRVLIEVKGDWHPELTAALKDQLADRYLADNLCRHGIYLVGWFRCMQYRKPITNGTLDWPLQKIVATLDEQAASESRSAANPHICAFVLNCGLR